MRSQRPDVLLDLRLLQGPGAGRGHGTYARGLVSGLAGTSFAGRVAPLLDADLAPPGLPEVFAPPLFTRRRWHGRFAAYEDAVALPADVARSGARIFHSLTLALPSSSRGPVVVTLHDLSPWVLRGRGMLGERIRHWPGRRLLASAERVIAVSQATADDATRVAGVRPERVTVVPEGVDTGLHPRRDAATTVADRFGLEPGYLLHVGALDRRKDPRSLLAAWRRVREKHPAVALVIAGNPGAQAPGDLAARGVTLLGRVSDDELAALYSVAGCLVLASRHEGFGLPVVEAMACGCPVVAFRNSSLPEVAGEAGLLVPDGDAVALGDAAATLLTDSDRRRIAIRDGQRWAAKFTWQRAGVATVKVYEELLVTLRRST